MRITLARWIAPLAFGLLLAAPRVVEAQAHGRAPAAERPQGWRHPASWRQLRVGMSQAEVARILGAPGKVTRYYAFTRWEYPDALGRRVNFDERGRLIAWAELAR